MSTKNIIRAWKDAEYRNSLSEIERASLPENPAGNVELTDAQLETAGGLAIRDNTWGSVCSYLCTLTCKSWGCPDNMWAIAFGGYSEWRLAQPTR